MKNTQKITPTSTTLDTLLATTKARKIQANPCLKYNHRGQRIFDKQTEVIIADNNMLDIANKIAVSAFKVVYDMSCNENILRIYNGLCAYLAKTANKPLDASESMPDGCDLRQELCLYLPEFVGKPLDFTTEYQNTKGNPLTVVQWLYKVAYKYIFAQKQHETKRIYLDDLCGNTVLVPLEWDCFKIHDFKTVVEIINKMDLSPRQHQVLNLRLRGKGYKKIAKSMGCSVSSVKTHIKALQDKAIKIGLAPHQYPTK